MAIASESYSNIQLHSVREGLATLEVSSKVFKIRFNNYLPVEVSLKGEDLSEVNSSLGAYYDVYEALSFIVKRGLSG